MTAVTIFNPDTNAPTISGRELHEKLGIETPYHKWFPRMCEYGFAENQDFFEVSDKIVHNPQGGRPATDHQLTLDMAKEICMLQRSEQGKAVRRYLLEVERQWNTPEAVWSRAMRMADAKMEELTGKVLHLEAANSSLTVQVEIMKPKADYFDELIDRKVNLSIRDTARQLGVKEKAFVSFLLAHKYLYRDKKGKLVPYAQYAGDLFESKECFNDKTNWGGTQTLITPKGRETFRLLTMGI